MSTPFFENREIPNEPALFTEGYPESAYPYPEPTERDYEPPDRDFDEDAADREADRYERTVLGRDFREP